MSNQFQKKYPKEVARFVTAGRKMGQTFTQITERVNERWPDLEATNTGIQSLYYRASRNTEASKKTSGLSSREEPEESDVIDPEDLIKKFKSIGYTPSAISKILEKEHGLIVPPKNINKGKAKAEPPKKLQVHLNWEEDDGEYIEVRVRVLVNQAANLLLGLLQGNK